MTYTHKEMVFLGDFYMNSASTLYSNSHICTVKRIS